MVDHNPRSDGASSLDINGGSQPPPEPNNVPVTFLERLRPGGPWLLTAIVPDGATTTITAHTTDQIEAFVRQHDGRANLYYSVNPTRTAMNKKAAKTNIVAIEYVLGDLDPASDETSEAAKARYIGQLDGALEPKPTAGIDSGNGIQFCGNSGSPSSSTSPSTASSRPRTRRRSTTPKAGSQR
jgi:hypothetical protein